MIAGAKVSDEDWKPLMAYQWHLNSGGAVHRAEAAPDGRQKNVWMHREIMGLPKFSFSHDLVVDHINGDRMDNRRENLRLATTEQNMQNKGIRKGQVSKFRGVHKHGKRWRAVGVVNRVQTRIGIFDTEMEAAQAAAWWRSKNMPFSREAMQEIAPPKKWEYAARRVTFRKKLGVGGKWIFSIRSKGIAHQREFDTEEQARDYKMRFMRHLDGIGTRSAAAPDAIRKAIAAEDRSPKRRKISDADVPGILRELESGKTLSQVAHIYGVDHSSIWHARAHRAPKMGLVVGIPERRKRRRMEKKET